MAVAVGDTTPVESNNVKIISTARVCACADARLPRVSLVFRRRALCTEFMLVYVFVCVCAMRVIKVTHIHTSRNSEFEAQQDPSIESDFYYTNTQ